MWCQFQPTIEWSLKGANRCFVINGQHVVDQAIVLFAEENKGTHYDRSKHSIKWTYAIQLVRGQCIWTDDRIQTRLSVQLIIDNMAFIDVAHFFPNRSLEIAVSLLSVQLKEKPNVDCDFVRVAWLNVHMLRVTDTHSFMQNRNFKSWSKWDACFLLTIGRLVIPMSSIGIRSPQVVNWSELWGASLVQIESRLQIASGWIPTNDNPPSERCWQIDRKFPDRKSSNQMWVNSNVAKFNDATEPNWWLTRRWNRTHIL